MFSRKDTKVCPLLKKPCIGVSCMWATKMRGTDPQSGSEIDEESCAIAWLPMLLTENVKASHETGAAVESLRNESSRNHGEAMAVVMQAGRILSGAAINNIQRD